jgi:toxin HigB-1
VSPQHAIRLRDILAVLDRSRKPDDMNLPGFRLHPLKGGLKGHWAVWVSGN